MRVGAFLDDPAVVHDHDPVGRADGREAVGDDDRRAVLHQPVERVLDQPLAFRVERRGRFVEQQQGRVAQQRAGDRDALALPARQARAAFAHEGVEALGKRAQEILGIGVARRLPKLRPRSRPNCRSADCRGREAAKITASCGTIAMRWRMSAGSASLQIDAVEQDAPVLRIVEALGELERVVLPAPDGPTTASRSRGLTAG